jgi:2-methylisocitrate lyase-like PEP mutase family enzyme
MSAAAKLRQALRAPLIAPSVYDALGARLAERAGFRAVFMSGFSVSAARLAAPDAGLVCYAEMLEEARCIAGAVAIPLLADADTGFGNVMNVRRTVEGYASAGAAALMLEDQASPKRDFGAPGPVVGREEALARIRAAVDARERGADILVIARTDARLATNGGLDEAMTRGRAFAELGADIVFHTGAQSEAEHAAFARNVAAPQIVQVDEPGRPRLSAAQGHAFGFRIALFGVTQALVAARALKDALAAQAQGEHPPDSALVSWAEMAEIVGAPGYVESERRLTQAQ